MGYNLTCDVCGKEEAVGVACVPFVPMSVAYGRECLQANAHPWDVLVANTACLNGLENACKDWKTMVEDTCKHLGKTMEEFNHDVEESIKTLDEYEG